MKKLLRKRVLIPLASIILFVSASGFSSDFFEIAKQIEIFTTLFKELNMNYVDETNPGELMDTAIKEMLKDLDPYTRFHNEQDVESYRINNTGEYTGIGASIRRKDGKLFIVEPYKNYPADKAGLKAGDEILQIGTIKVEDSKEETGVLLKGAPNTSVDIIYKRQGKVHTATLTRSSIDIDAVPFYKKINNNTGYIVLDKFNRKAASQTEKALVDLKAEGATQIILDLRSNPGGLLREAIKIVNLFVPKNQVIVTTKSKVKKYNKTYSTTNEPVDTAIPLIVLVNDKSASASEIVSGALQDLDRAVIVGSRSFGKGLVQRPKKLSYGTQLKVTISRYYTPSGRCIQALDYRKRDDKGNAVRTDKNDYTAFKTKNGRTVYDGGGINPDIKIKEEAYNNIAKALIRENIIFDYCTKFYYEHQFNAIDAFTFTDKDYNEFKTFVVNSSFDYKTNTEKLLDQVKQKAVEDELNISLALGNVEAAIKREKIEALNANKELISTIIKDQLITRYFYREGLYNYHVNNQATIATALDIFTTKKYAELLK